MSGPPPDTQLMAAGIQSWRIIPSSQLPIFPGWKFAHFSGANEIFSSNPWGFSMNFPLPRVIPGEAKPTHRIKHGW